VYFPFNIDIVLTSRLITESHTENHNNKKFLNINGRIVTDDDVYYEILYNKDDQEDIP